MTEAPAPAATQIVSVAPPPRTTWKDWLPVIALLLTISGVLYTSGRTVGQIADNTRRIDQLELLARQRDDQLHDLQANIAGINGKLDLLLMRQKASDR